MHPETLANRSRDERTDGTPTDNSSIDGSAHSETPTTGGLLHICTACMREGVPSLDAARPYVVERERKEAAVRAWNRSGRVGALSEWYRASRHTVENCENLDYETRRAFQNRGVSFLLLQGEHYLLTCDGSGQPKTPQNQRPTDEDDIPF